MTPWYTYTAPWIPPDYAPTLSQSFPHTPYSAVAHSCDAVDTNGTPPGREGKAAAAAGGGPAQLCNANEHG
jgi:hypothetical protein